MKEREINCKICGKPFLARLQNEKYCSIECKQKVRLKSSKHGNNLRRERKQSRKEPILQWLQPAEKPFMCKKFFLNIRVCRMVSCGFYPCNPCDITSNNIQYQGVS